MPYVKYSSLGAKTWYSKCSYNLDKLQPIRYRLEIFKNVKYILLAERAWELQPVKVGATYTWPLLDAGISNCYCYTGVSFLKSIPVNSWTNSNEVLHAQPQIDHKIYKNASPRTGFEQMLAAWWSSTLSIEPRRLVTRFHSYVLTNYKLKIWGCAWRTSIWKIQVLAGIDFRMWQHFYNSNHFVKNRLFST